MILTKSTTVTTINTPSVTTVPTKKLAYPKTVTGPDDSTSPAEAVYKLSEYNNETGLTAEEQIEFDGDKENITWVFWVDGGLMDSSSTQQSSKDKLYIVVGKGNQQVVREETQDSDIDFTQVSTKDAFKKALEDKGYLYSKVEIVEENGKQINKLTIKFSKWLDTYNVYVEPFRNTPEHNIVNDNVKTTALSAEPEIVDAYWLDAQGKRITSIGFETNIKFYIETLGLLGETIKLRLFDYDGPFNPSDSIPWNGGVVEHQCEITDRKFTQDYYVEASDATAYENAHSWVDGDLDVYIRLEMQDTSIPITLEERYANIHFLENQNVELFFAKREEVIVNGQNYIQYSKLNTVFPGMTAYLVAQVANVTGSVTMSVYEESPLLVAANVKLPLLNENNQSATDFTATVVDNYAVVPVKFQELDSATYNSWNNLLMSDNGNLHESELFLKTTINSEEYVSSESFKILSPVVVQKIYHDGFISKENYIQEIIRKVKFEYHNTDTNSPYDFGIFDIDWAQKWIRGSYSGGSGWKKEINGGKTRYYKYDGTPGVNKVPLVSIFETSLPTSDHKVFDYQNGGTSFLRISDNSSREYFNPERLASILGAVKQTGFDDVTLMGSVDTDGTGAYSVTHVNGKNIDLRYLRTDNKRPLIDPVSATNPAKVPRILISDSLFDETRMNILIDALYDFGFARLKKNYSYKFGVDNRLLNHSTHLADHHHHLHIQGFKANYK